MRHRIAGRQFSVESDHRRAMLRNLAAGVIEHGQIVTTLPKAKAVQPYVEKLITLARRRTLAARRLIQSRINDRAAFAWVADPNVKDSRKKSEFWDLPPESAIEFNRYGELKKAPRLVHHLITTVAPMFEGRSGGYTRIVKLDRRRLGDATNLVVLQLVGKESGSQVSGGRSGRRSQADKRTAYAAKIRKAGAAAAAPAAKADGAGAGGESAAEQG